YVEYPVRRCRNMAKPLVDLQQVCSRAPCPELPRVVPGRTTTSFAGSGWYPSSWQQCSVSCGGGVQIRTIQCLQQSHASTGCPAHLRPITSRACNTNFCPAASPAPAPHNRVLAAGPTLKDERCIDHFNWCHLVPQHGVCNHRFYGQQCCKSCSSKKP
ncbi:hypothetical protein XENORESO_015822, partial [Xenotaenia resolanae]